MLGMVVKDAFGEEVDEEEDEAPKAKREPPPKS